MEPIHVLSTIHFSDEQLDRLRAVSPRLRLIQHTIHEPSELPPDFWSEVEVLCTWQLMPAPDQAPRLRWVQLISAGADHAIAHPALSGGVVLTTTSGIHAINIGEYVLALMLAWAHKLPALLDHQRRAEWPEERYKYFTPQELRGQTVGIVGYGSIGREVGRLARALGMRVLAVQRGDDRTDHGYIIPGVGDPEGRIPERFYRPDAMCEMLSECDYVVLAVPLTGATRNLIGIQALRAMKPTAFLINIARGGIVDEPALIQALQEGWIGGAGLDVFAQEPLPADSPLWRLPNVVLTPHVAGFTNNYNERTADVFAENLYRYLTGRPLINQVDWAREY